jgi:integrase
MLMRSFFTALKRGEEGGAMGLFKRKDSECWQMCFFLEGKKVRESTGTSNKKIAQRILDKTRGKVAEGKYNKVLKSHMPFFELVDQFIEKHSRVEKKSFKRDEVIGEALKKFFGKIPIGQITALDIKEWRRRRSQHVTNKGTPIKKASLNRELAFMKTMFGLAVEWGWLEANPAEKIKLLRGEEKRLRILSKAEIARLIDSAADYLKAIIVTAISTGMRKAEILNLRWKHVDLFNNFIRVASSKNDESRDVPIDSHLKETLMKLKKGRRSEDFVFTRNNGEPITCMKEAFFVACKRAGIEDFRFHDLRHTAASLLAGGGCDIITLQNILGHKSLSMTQRYAHLIPERHQKAREIMESFWQAAAKSSGDTKSDTVAVPEEMSAVTH